MTYRGSLRTRGATRFQVAATSRARDDLDLAAQGITGAYVCYEAQGVRLAQGHLVSPRWVLWTPIVEAPRTDLELTAFGAPPRPRAQKTTRHKGITRVDVVAGLRPNGTRRRASHGYMARVVWQKQRTMKWFSDARHGDRLGALTAALAWRDATEQALGKPRTEQMVIGTARTNTGLVGIAERSSGPRGRRVFEVTWRTVDGKTQRTSYSIDKHGRRRALARAKHMRRVREQARLG